MHRFGSTVGRQIQLWHGTKSLFGQCGVGLQIHISERHGKCGVGAQCGCVGGQIQVWQAMNWLGPIGAAAAPRLACMIGPSRKLPFGRCDPAGPWINTASRLIQTRLAPRLSCSTASVCRIASFGISA
jgi:hypothetical protein